jgi:hypothetical protein
MASGLFARRRWWRNEGLAALRLMALEHWDPAGVYDHPEQADTYDLFLERLHRMLRGGAGTDEIARYLGAVRVKVFKRDENEEVDESFAARVVTWYQLEAPQ